MKLNLKRDKRHVLNGDWNLKDLDRDMNDIYQREHIVWGRLLTKAAAVRDIIQEKYNQVIAAELQHHFLNLLRWGLTW